MKRICVNVTPEQAEALKDRAREYGIPQATQIRRALEDYLSCPPLRDQSVSSARQPVLFTANPQKETR
jgi:hypothetical protein